MGDYRLMAKWFLCCSLAANYAYGRYINNIGSYPFPYPTNMGFPPYQSYPMMPFVNPYQSVPWMNHYLSNMLPDQQMLNITNESDLFHLGNYPMIGNIKTEIIDVDPAYHRKILGLNADNNQVSVTTRKPRFKVDVNSASHNFTSVRQNIKPIVNTKSYTIRRSFIIDASNSTNIKPINIHFVNGVEVTDPPPITTTEDESVQPVTSWIEDEKLKTN
ncbi:hypothetical protein GWI33_006354 [Rhynchophorus ferrugineus]|uniref:Uncharacterized protein n=1 Tax=Rhynchophorus ferrugineus TaxID=354439 RepID=A0A834IY86_RHYFE|nr:hypothetical protein GWI33_006354 [Rhynchophorus ferrugineus]